MTDSEYATQVLAHYFRLALPFGHPDIEGEVCAAVDAIVAVSARRIGALEAHAEQTNRVLDSLGRTLGPILGFPPGVGAIGVRGAPVIAYTDDEPETEPLVATVTGTAAQAAAMRLEHAWERIRQVETDLEAAQAERLAAVEALAAIPDGASTWAGTNPKVYVAGPSQAPPEPGPGPDPAAWRVATDDDLGDYYPGER